MSKIREKRDSLLQFVEEQIIGPGANGITYSRLKNINNLSQPINYTEEIINYQPLSLGYSSAILFPKKKVVQTSEEGEQEGGEETGNGDIAEDGVEERVEEFELDQQFPRQMGMTFCLKQEFLDNKEDLEIEVSFRTYEQLSSKEKNDTENPVGVYIEDRKAEFIQLLETNTKLKSFIEVLNENEDASLLRLTKTSADDLKELKALCSELLDKKLEVLIEKLKENGFEKIDGFRISTVKEKINNQLKIEITDNDIKIKIFNAYSEYERFEWFVSFFKDLIKVVENEIWEAKSHKKLVKVSDLDLKVNDIKKTILHNKPHNHTVTLSENGKEVTGGLDSIYVNKVSNTEGSQKLCLNIQLSRDTRDRENNGKEFYVKLQLLNESTHVREGKIDNKTKIYSVANKDVNRKSFFGVELTVKSKYLKPYTDVKITKDTTTYNEDEVSKFSYRQFEDYGTGHGCSIEWNKRENIVKTTYLPINDTPDVDAVPRDKTIRITKGSSVIDKPFIENSRAQEFKFLSTFSEASNTDIIKELNSFVNSYKTWIENKKKYYDNALEKNLIDQELEKCSLDYKRISKNINFLEDDDSKMLVFRLMNSAMFMQLLHINKGGETGVDITNNNEGEDYYKNANDTIFSSTDSAGWRAFQLAFILLNLDGIFKHSDDEKWEKRNDLVDLVWFPTGGGKTEAYLGLIALVILNRRLNVGETGGGVSVIMRYTLRLLTLQQFQRASYLIMALELMRRWNDALGKEPITIGLWVGASSLPNRLDDLKSEIEKLLNNQGNNIPFQKCPWCGDGLKTHTNNSNNIFEKHRHNLSCINKKCSFYTISLGQGPYQGCLPLNLCDESIYRHPPSLLFGTVDKFAQLAHKVAQEGDKDSRRLFGRGKWRNGKPNEGYLPPDLIIQDELHLLLGPLGSAVGLFESAIDQLCTQSDGTLPKIITSTATTRNTNLQIAGLFNRKVQIFPKPGVECDDTFFSFYKRHYDENDNEVFEAKRRYLGMMPTGRSHVWMQMRLAAIMLTHRAVFESEQSSCDANPITGEGYSNDLIEAMDNYHSILSYFNSTREVGKTQSQIQTYIKKEMLKIFNRVIRPTKMMHLIYTNNDIEEGELTGRLSGEDVKSSLDSVSKKWGPAKRFASSGEKGSVPPEFIAATNMISVGLDVGRFNQILMNSMPRNKAEYIQASSRVARSKKGLVITIHHPFKSRDVSHFEKFIEFHEKMYSYVEPISITPFTNKAVDKYLSLYIGTMIRHLCDEKFADTNGAGSINVNDVTTIKASLMKYFNKRIAKWESSDDIEIKNILKEGNLNYIEEYIDIAIHQWLTLKGNSGDLHYKKWRQRDYLYNEGGDLSENEDTSHWSISGSLRVIEPNSVIKIK
jgi:hypothetical protein